MKRRKCGNISDKASMFHVNLSEKLYKVVILKMTDEETSQRWSLSHRQYQNHFLFPLFPSLLNEPSDIYWMSEGLFGIDTHYDNFFFST